MFALRAQQLQRQLLKFIKESSDPNFKQFAEGIMVFIFGTITENQSISKDSLLSTIYLKVHQIYKLEQVLLRALSLLATDQLSENTLYRLFGLVIFSNMLLEYLSEQKGKDVLFNPAIKLSEEKFNKFTELISKSDKPKNTKIDSFQECLLYFIDQSGNHIEEIQKIHDFGEILIFIYGTNLFEQMSSIKQIDKGNLKEMILSLGYEGPLVQEGFKYYDGLVAFTMGIFTIISGTEYDTPDLQQKVNSILTTIGNSSRVMLNLQRLRKNAQQRNQIFDEMQNSSVEILAIIQNHDSPISEHMVLKFLEIITTLPNFDIDFHPLPDLIDLPGYSNIFGLAILSSSRKKLEEIWKKYQANIIEVHAALTEINEFLLSVIKTANDLIVHLKNKKLQKPLPRQDIDLIENAGIHISSITTNGVCQDSGIQIPLECFDVKEKLWKQFQTNWKQISGLFQKWAQEEQSISSLGNDVRPFTELFQAATYIINELTNQGVFKGSKEETILIIRMIGTINNVLDQILQVLDPVKNLRFNTANLNNFFPVIQNLSQPMSGLKNVAEILILVNNISKSLYHLSRETVIILGLDARILETPLILEPTLKEIPNLIQKEYAQRFINKEEKDAKMQQYSDLLQNFQQLIKMPQFRRQLIWPLEDFLK